MESDGEELENIFEEYENVENDGEAINTENIQDTHGSSGVKVPVPKRIIKNPRLKFNAERLCGERGIPVLLDHFKNVKFKGVGHEKEDLDKLLTKLEHWTHRLFPSMKFEDCLHHIEKLGKKRPVQTCLRKIRFNMPILSRDFLNENEDDVHRVDDPEPVDEVDAFDRLIDESQDMSNLNVCEVNPIYSSQMKNSFGMGQVLGSESGSSLTDEQRERMERNRILAAERRKARLASLQDNSLPIKPANKGIIPSPTISHNQELFENSFRNEGNIPDTSCDLFSKYSSDNLNVEESPPKLINHDSKNLGLNELIALVDDKEPVSYKNTIAFSTTSVPNNTNNEIIISDNEDNLGIESLLDLVNEESGDIP